MMALPTLKEYKEEALSWLGTPNKHAHSTKGQGCDCVGLISGVITELTGEEFNKPPYSESWSEVSDKEYLLEELDKHLIILDQLEEPCVLAFRMKENAIVKHLGIYVGSGRFIHSATDKEVRFSNLSKGWLKRLTKIYGFKHG